MFIEPVPIFGAVTGGLSANYLIDFGVDLNHTIPLRAMWQGSPVECRTLYIDNYTNSVPFRVTNGNSSQLVPQYAVGTVDISGFDDVTLTSEGAAKVNVSLLSHVPSKYGFDIRGALPASLTNDPYWSDVTGLFHFDALTTATTIINEKNQTFSFTIQNTSTNKIVNSPTLYGSSQLHINTNAATNAFFNASVAAPMSAYTFEVALTPTVNDGVVGRYYVISNVEASAAYAFIFALKCSGSSTFSHICMGATGGTAVTFLELPFEFNSNTTYHLSYVMITSTRSYIYVNGNLIGELNGTMDAGTHSATSYIGAHRNLTDQSSNPLFSMRGYYDELRVTNKMRYTATKYDIQTAPFLNQ